MTAALQGVRNSTADAEEERMTMVGQYLPQSATQLAAVQITAATITALRSPHR
jgi:hypothetical protein